MPGDKRRAVANARERNRTSDLNQAYKMLQSIIPKEPSDKMSKIHTLKLTLSYIDFLNNILRESDEQIAASSSVSDGNSTPGKHMISPSASNSSSLTSYANLPAMLDDVHHHHARHHDPDQVQQQHPRKRARLDSFCLYEQHAGVYPGTPMMQPNTCHIPAAPASATYSNQHYQQMQPINNNLQPSYEYSSQKYSTNFKTGSNNQVQNDTSKTLLRDAFREYRSGKRKRPSSLV